MAAITFPAEHSIMFQVRNANKGDCINVTGGRQRWLKLDRHGYRITASTSDDGSDWTDLGEDTVSMNDPIEVGLVITSHSPGNLSEAGYDNVTVHVDNPPDDADNPLK